MRKIAIPSRDGQVDEHFGHCGYFTVLTVGDVNGILSEETFEPPAQCGCRSNLVEMLVAMGVGALIAGNMGQGAADKLRHAGLTVVRGASGPVRDAATAFLAGTLKDKDELCQAHGHDCLHPIA
ncbi:Dinitrogenase iron-molybdenum cofactor biosynthesis protein [Solidesulfovibrio fructosivorans JJ]]|uniref:Dinitrogenase iron-molybdenum cofactor biosynthesis protein n=1 Tax=Solidesulfovibrio fructosivorans JJ] TaxID=596151 RepID=E1JY91_SOLFR|nr:NifB/NifX family molybdenum-iron cluster-binding protein [Solidesulfovibrio fructosivorans]EFL50665.1 Dinitrogenase iron-molybdenum cofactor biosynthesis protein [Solidesulfovibrio fructosivorans JJ]]